MEKGVDSKLACSKYCHADKCQDIAKLFEVLAIDEQLLDTAKEQTQCKINYVLSYTERWLYYAAHNSRASQIVFIDCMCNAGVYRNKTLGTAVRVSILFTLFAKHNPRKEFVLVINDLDKKRIDTCKAVCKYAAGLDIPSNFKIVSSDLDVNEFLESFDSKCYWYDSYSSMTLLFADPYNARTVSFSVLKKFLEQHYSELLFNWFSSDFVRNKNDQAILRCFEGLELREGKEAITTLLENIKVGKIKHAFSYSFRISNNTELYQILFATPNIAGLRELKKTLWTIFGGQLYHRNEKHDRFEQLRLLNSEELQDVTASGYAAEARELLCEEYQGQIVRYNEIEVFILERTMLSGSQILKYVLRPLVKQGAVVKDGPLRSWKINSYRFRV